MAMMVQHLLQVHYRCMTIPKGKITSNCNGWSERLRDIGTFPKTKVNNAGKNPKAKMSHFQEISETPMLSHLATKTFSFLGAKDIVNCRLVSKSFNHLIKTDMHYWRLQVDEIEKDPEFIKHFPNWKKVFQYFRKRKISDIDCFSTGMRDFLKNGNFLFDARDPNLPPYLADHYKEKIEGNEPKNHPIFHAMNKNDVDFFKILLHSPVDFNETAGLWDYTPLIWSTLIENPEFLQIILEHKEEKNINLRCVANDEGVLYYANRSKNLKAVKILLNYIMENDLANDLVPPEFFSEVCYRSRKDDNLEIIKLIINNATPLKIDVNFRYAGGETCLHLLMGYGNFESLEYLLTSSDEHGLDVNLRCNSGTTPYLFACEIEGKTAAEIFEKCSSVDLEASLSDGRTAHDILSKRE